MSERTLGRYRVTAPAGGGTGGVLHARDTLLERRVDLLPVPAAAAAEPARLARIRQEVERAAAFVHPNAAAVYGLEEAEGELFAALEPPAGRSLADLMAAGELPRETALEVAAILCDVLTGAKAAGVVHGGLHPGDLFLAEDGSITVAGFGLHELRLAVEEAAGATSPAASYRPPEAAPGVLPDHRGDLFALGRLLHEMLASGERPAGAEGAPPPAGGLERVLELCLAEEPARRAASAAELRPHLEEAQRELLREPEPEPEPPEAPPGSRLSAPTLWGGLAAIVLLLALAGWALWRGPGGPGRDVEQRAAEPAPATVQRVDLAVMPFSAADDPASALLARGFGLEVTRLLERERRVTTVAAGSAAAAVSDGPTLQMLGQRLGAEHVLEGSFRWQRDDEISHAEVTVRLSRAEDGEVLLSETLEGFFGEIVGLQDRVASIASRRLRAAGRPGASRPLTSSLAAYEAYLEAVARAAEATTPEERRTVAALLEEATLLDPGLLPAHTLQVRLQAGDAAGEAPAEPLAAARRALAAARQIDPQDPEVRRAAAVVELASGGDPAVALGELVAALEGLPGHPGPLRSLALIDRRQGRWDEAIERLSAARRRDPLDLGLATELVRTLAWKRRFAEAGEEVDRLARARPGASEPVLLRADLLLLERGSTAEARAALDGLPEAGRADPRWQERMLRLDLYSGEYDAALARLPALGLEEAEELIERAWIHRHAGSERRAAAAFEEARDLLDDRLETMPGDPGLSSLLGQAYAGTGGLHLAARMGQRAVSQLPVTVDAVAGVELVERLALTYVLVGDHEHALDELAFLLEIPSPVTVAVLRLDPAWRPLRGEPRFQALLRHFAPVRD